mgnify:CR=1 FL=1
MENTRFKEKVARSFMERLIYSDKDDSNPLLRAHAAVTDGLANVALRASGRQDKTWMTPKQRGETWGHQQASDAVIKARAKASRMPAVLTKDRGPTRSEAVDHELRKLRSIEGDILDKYHRANINNGRLTAPGGNRRWLRERGGGADYQARVGDTGAAAKLYGRELGRIKRRRRALYSVGAGYDRLAAIDADRNFARKYPGVDAAERRRIERVKKFRDMGLLPVPGR